MNTQAPGATQNPPATNAPPSGAPPASTTPPGADPNAKPPGTIYEAAGVEPPKAGTWPDDWRERLANGDEKRLEQLKRFDTPSKIADSYFDTRGMIMNGVYKRAKPADGATPEQLTAWRTEHGLPAKPEEFSILGADVKLETLPAPVQENVKALQSTFFDAEMSPAQAGKVLETYNKLVEAQTEAIVAADATAQDALEDHLRAEWGPNYRSNVDMNAAFLERQLGSGDLTTGVLLARLPDDKSLGELAGRRIVDLPVFNKLINQMARVMMPELLEGAEGGAAGKNVEQRIEELRKIMSTDMAKYRREGLDKEYERLMGIQEQRGKIKAVVTGQEEWGG